MRRREAFAWLIIIALLVAGATTIAPGAANLTNAVGTLAVGKGGTGATTLTGLALGNGTSAFTAYGGTSCTNQFPRSLSAAGAATCASVANTDLANSSTTVSGSTGLTISGSPVSLGGTVTLTRVAPATGQVSGSTTVTVTSATFATVTGYSITITTTSTKVLLLASASFANDTLGQDTFLTFTSAGTNVGNSSSGLLRVQNTLANDYESGSIQYLATVTAGSVTFTFQMARSGGTTTLSWANFTAVEIL